MGEPPLPLTRHSQGAGGKHAHRAHEAHHKGGDGVVLDLRRATDLLNLCLQIAQPGPQLLTNLYIEGAEGLIEEQHLQLRRRRLKPCIDYATRVAVALSTRMRQSLRA